MGWLLEQTQTYSSVVSCISPGSACFALLIGPPTKVKGSAAFPGNWYSSSQLSQQGECRQDISRQRPSPREKPTRPLYQCPCPSPAGKIRLIPGDVPKFGMLSFSPCRWVDPFRSSWHHCLEVQEHWALSVQLVHGHKQWKQLIPSEFPGT